MSTVTFPAVAGGATYTDDSDATTGLAAGGHKTRFIPALKAVVDTAADVVVKSSTAAASAAAAAASAAYINGVAGGGTAAALAGSATQDFAAKTLTATTVNANNIGEITHSQGIVTTYAASGSTGIQIANNDNLNFGTGDCTLVWKGSLPDWATVALQKLMHKGSNGSPRYYMAYGVSGHLYVIINTVTYTCTATTSFINNSVHQLTASIVRETATTAGSITFSADGAQLGSVITIPTGTPLTVSGTETFYVCGDNVVRTAATTQAAYAFNRALSADEVLSLYKSPYGVAESDKWGKTDVLSGSWLNGYTTTFATFTSANSGGFTASDTGTKAGVRVQVLGTIPKGRSYKLHFTPTFSGVTNIKFYIAWNYYSGVQDISTLITSGVTTSITFTNNFTSDATSVMIICDVANGSISLSGVSLEILGCKLALEPEGIQPSPGQWLDSSTNKLHALQPATGSSLARKKESFEIRWTNTWAGTSEAQYIAGINQAIIPVNGYIESIVAVVTGTAVQNIIAGDGVDTDRWVTLTSGLTAGTQTLAIANRVSDGTNRKMTVAPSATATMSISWVIKGILL